VKATVSIPVLGNGDVRTVADIERMKSLTGCDGVMIGRAAVGNPWIFSRLDRQDVLPEQVYRVIELHLQRMLSFYGEARGLVIFRKHANQYLTASGLSSEIRRSLLTTASADEFLSLLQPVLE
jgi:tRNA-dihydrouridine synthase